jgi:hypothetical protein
MDWLPIYAAGFFDGEGSAVIRRKPPQIKSTTSPLPRYRVEALIRITNRDVLEMLQARWGGSIIFSKAPKSHWKDWYQWQIQATKAMTFLQEILPYLIIKKQQAELAIQFQKHIIESGKLRYGGQGLKRYPYEEIIRIRDGFFYQMKALNLRGKEPFDLTEGA